MSRAICRNPRRAAARNNSSHQSFETFISSGKACVTELANVEGEKLTTISARLKTLHDVRLVKRRREAKHIYDRFPTLTFCVLWKAPWTMQPNAENHRFPVNEKGKRQ